MWLFEEIGWDSKVRLLGANWHRYTNTLQAYYAANVLASKEAHQDVKSAPLHLCEMLSSHQECNGKVFLEWLSNWVPPHVLSAFSSLIMTKMCSTNFPWLLVHLFHVEGKHFWVLAGVHGGIMTEGTKERGQHLNPLFLREKKGSDKNWRRWSRTLV